MTDTTYDILILGAGPAGISAALTARARGQSVLVVSNDPLASPLAKAPAVDNYPGLAGKSGKELLSAMLDGLAEQQIPLVTGRVTAVMPFGDVFMATVGQAVYSARSLILATGMAPGKAYPGEREYLGSGVSYCATCDGMLYRGRKVAVIGLADDAEEEAKFLRSIGCEAEYFDRKRARTYEILGDENGRVTALLADGEEYPAEGVFILRNTVASAVLLPGLAEEAGHIAADRTMKTNIPGVFAAGDCIGRPYQAAKAAGEGNLAALSADAYLKEKMNESS